MLTDAAIRAAKPGAKDKKMFDRNGLHLLITPSGAKYWHHKYRFDGKEKNVSLGVYPAVSLGDARDALDENRKMLKRGINPSTQRRALKTAKSERAANTFEVIAREWFAKKMADKDEGHQKRVLARLERDVFPWIGDAPIKEISAPLLLEVLQRIENRGSTHTAHRTRGTCSQVFRYGISVGQCERDPAQDLRGALTRVKEEHFSAVTESVELAKILQVLDQYRGTFPVECALRIAPIVFVRPGELRKAAWQDIDLDKGEWCLKLSKQIENRPKAPGADDHLIIPLPFQVTKILKDLHRLTGCGKYVFSGIRTKSRPMSDNTVLAALRTLGIPKEEMCGHGFRAAARTILVQELHIRPDLVEHQLGHQVIDPNGRAYNRATFLPERRLMLQKWADHLDKLKSGEKIVPLRAVHLTDIKSIMIPGYE